GEGSSTPTKLYYTPSPEAQQTSSTTHSSPTFPPVTTAPIPTVTPSDTLHLRQYTKRVRIAQSSVLSPVADESASSLRDVSQGEACPIDSGFEADQDRVNIAKTSTLPHESTSRVTSLAADEGKSSCWRIKIEGLQNDLEMMPPIKRRNLDKGEAAAKRVSDNKEEMATILTLMDAASILSSGGVQVVPTAAEIAGGRDGKRRSEDERIDCKGCRSCKDPCRGRTADDD
nr:hypothetical protein [Tanacetum cinerariifolium]